MISPTAVPPIVVYEDRGWQKLLPLVYVRAAFQLICGMDDLLSKVRWLVGSSKPASNGRSSTPVELWCRPALADLVAEQTGLPTNRERSEPTLFLNGRGLWTSVPEFDPADGPWVGTVGSDPQPACIAADAMLADALSPSALLDEARSRAALARLPHRDVSEHVKLFEWPWQIVLANEEVLVHDWKRLVEGHSEIQGPIGEGVYLLNRGSIHIGTGTRIKPCAVIDAEDGPVWIGRNAKIMPHTYIQGPAFIGDNALIQPGAVIHEGTTIGPTCKVGGEVEASIIHGFSNKQHDGFLGHSYVCQWVNIAADCINSDLKNTYGTIRVPINGREVDTGEMFVGMLVGDFSKSGINVSFPTGAVIGFCSSVFNPSSPKFVPSFAWITGDKYERYDEGRGLAIAQKVMARRKQSMSPAEEQAFLAVRQQALAIEHEPQVVLEGFTGR